MTAVTEADVMGSPALRIPPHSTEAEQSVLGGLLLDNGAWDRVGDLLTEADFYGAAHRVIFGVIGAMVNATKAADVITVFERLQSLGKADDCGGLAYLNALAQSVPSAANVRRYAQIVRENSIRRQVIAQADELSAMMWDRTGDLSEQLQIAGAMFSGIQRGQVRKAPAKLADLVVKTIDRVNEIAEGNEPPGWPIGIPGIDRGLAGGLKPGKVYCIAARPSVGKSSLARLFALSTAENGLPTLLLSQEMPGDEVTGCILSQLGHIESTHIPAGQLAGDEWDRFAEAADRAGRAELWIDDQGGLTLNDIRTKARMVPGLKVLVLDYLQLTASRLKDATRNDQIGEVSRGLKALALELGIAVVMLSQLNRESEKRGNKEPELSDLRSSGEIEQDTDVAILLWTVKEMDEGARRIVGCKFAKHRGGPKPRFALNFNAAIYQWSESTASLDMTRTEYMAGRKGGFDE